MKHTHFKKAMSALLSIVMVISGCSFGLTAYAKDSNRNNSDPEPVYEATFEYLDSLFNFDSATFKGLIEKASYSLMKPNVSKEAFLTQKYGSLYTNNEEIYNAAFAPLDNEDADETDWTFYQLYKFCESGKESENAALKNYCEDAFDALDALLKACEKNLVFVEESDTAIRNLYPDFDDENISSNTLSDVGNVFNANADNTLNQLVTSNSIIEALDGYDYYFNYYVNVFDKLAMRHNDNGLPTALNDAAALFLFHCGSFAKIILYTYIYIYLMDKAGTPITANKLISGNDTVITVNNLDTIKADYPLDSFRNDYIGSDKAFPYTGRSAAVRSAIYNTYWMYAIFDKYILNGSTLDDFNTNFESVSPDYFNLLKGLNADAKLATGEFADADSLAEAMLEGMGDKAYDYQIGESGIRIADYFINEVCNEYEETYVDEYDYSDFDTVPASAAVYAANENLNESLSSTLNMTNPVDVNKLCNYMLETDVDLFNEVKDIWLNLYTNPGKTVYDLIPLYTVLFDSIYPVLFHDDIDDHTSFSNLLGVADDAEPYLTVEKAFLAPDALSSLFESITGTENENLNLYNLSQEAGDTEVGIGALHIDLNKAVPAVLHYLTGDTDTAAELVGYYSDVEYKEPLYDEVGNVITDDMGNVVYSDEVKTAHYDNSVLRFTNIYIIDVKLTELKDDLSGGINEISGSNSLDKSDELIIKELLTILRDSVDDYLMSVSYSPATGAVNKNLIKKADGTYNEGNDGLNYLSCAIPEIANIFANNIYAKYHIGDVIPPRLTNCIETREIDGVVEYYNTKHQNIYDSIGTTSKNKLNVLFDNYAYDLCNYFVFINNYVLEGFRNPAVIAAPFENLYSKAFDDHTYAEIVTAVKQYADAFTNKGAQAAYDTINDIHTPTNGEVITAATCKDEGVARYECAICGKTYTKRIPKTAHTVVSDLAVPATFKAAGKTAGSHCSVCNTVIVAQKAVPMLDSPSLSKVKKGKKRFTAKWGAVAGVDGYEIQYSRKKNMKSAKIKTVTGYSANSITVKKLKAKKTYYVRIRAYKQIGNNTIYSDWSARKKVKTKK